MGLFYIEELRDTKTFFLSFSFLVVAVLVMVVFIVELMCELYGR